MREASFTIAGLAREASVGVETVRYYERRGLVPRPARTGDAYRRYGRGHVDRIRFVKRAQDLGFTLEEIGSLLELEDGTDRRSIRRIAAARLEETRRRIGDLQRIERVLARLLHDCETHSKSRRCPIVAAIALARGDGAASVPRHGAHQTLLPVASRLRTSA